MLKRFLEDNFNHDNQWQDLFEPNKKKLKLTTIINQESQSVVIDLFSSLQVFENILEFIDSIGTQLAFINSSKRAIQLKRNIPKYFLCDLNIEYLKVSKKENLYRLEGFLRNLYFKEGIILEIDELMKHDPKMIHYQQNNSFKNYFVNGWIEVMGFQMMMTIGSEGNEFYSSVHVKLMTYSETFIIIHQNINKVKGGKLNYYLAQEMEDSKLITLIDTSKNPTISKSVLNNLLFLIKGNMEMDIFLRIMLECGGVSNIDRYLKRILSPRDSLKKDKTDKKDKKKKKKDKKEKKKIKLENNRWCTLNLQYDSFIIDLLRKGNDFKHCEILTRHLIYLIYKSVGSFSQEKKKNYLKRKEGTLLKNCVPVILNQFIEGICFEYGNTFKYIATFRKCDGGGQFKIILLGNREHQDDEEADYHENSRLIILDPIENIFLDEIFDRKDEEQQDVFDVVALYFENLTKIDFETLANSVMTSVFIKGFKIDYGKDISSYSKASDFNTTISNIWKDSGVPEKRQKSLSATINTGQLITPEDLDPLTLFWMDHLNDLTCYYYYGDVIEETEPKLKSETNKYITKLLSEYRSIDRDTIYYQEYDTNIEAHCFCSGIVYDFEYADKNLYYVTDGNSGNLHYCAIVKDNDDIIICGNGYDTIFYWTKYGFFSTSDDDYKEEGTNGLVSLDKLKHVTLDTVLDNVEKFFNQFK